MVKYVKHVIVCLLFSVITLSIVYAATTPEIFNKEAPEFNNFPYIDDMLLSSARYTQTEDIDPERLATYMDEYHVSYTEDELIFLGFEKALENDQFILYFDKISFSILLYNKETSYYWSSRAEHQALSDANRYTRNLMNSGLHIDMVRRARPDTIIRESILNISDAYYLQDDSIDPKLAPYAIDEDSIQTQRIDIQTEIQDQTLETHIHIRSAVLQNISNNINISFQVNITLNETGLSVEIPHDAIEEGTDVFRLVNISVFPYFGATRQDKVPGYFMIPDNMGALVRLDSRYNTAVQDIPFYSNDFAYNINRYQTKLSVPIFGVVHLNNTHAFYVEIESGAETSFLQIALWSQNTQYQRINARYAVRQLYRSVINRAGDGAISVHEQKVAQDYLAHYRFLSDEDANYVGMAKDYREQLINRGTLTEREQIQDGYIPMHTGIILSDQEPSFIGTQKVTMTTIAQATMMYDTLTEGGIPNQHVTLFGWSNDGYLERTPYRLNFVESSQSFRNLSSQINVDDNRIYLENDYVMSASSSARVSYNNDVALGLSRLRITFTSIGLNDRRVEFRVINPQRSLRFANSDQSGFDGLGIDGLSLSTMGYYLNSYVIGNTLYDRHETIEAYQTITALYDSMQLTQPNVYLWDNLDSYIGMEIANYQYNYYTDLVPILPIILKGSISYFGTYLNFNVMGQNHLLQMIDFGINPSYIYTYEDTYKMRYTRAAQFYTTKFDDFKDDTQENYAYINQALSHVMGAKIEQREVLETGVVRVSYDNGVLIYINYQTSPVTFDGHTIPAQDYRVVVS